MNTRTISLVGFSLFALVGGCRKIDTTGITFTTSSSSSAPSATPSVAAVQQLTLPAVSPDLDPCDKNETYKPQTASLGFAWSETPSLESAPKDGVYISIANGPAIQVESVELWVDKKRNEWDLRAETDGPGMGPSLSFKGAPHAGQLINDAFGSNRGYFQVPQKGGMANCSRQTTSYNGENARIVKITAYDEQAKTASGSFVTTWHEGFDEKRVFWAAGTFTNAKVVIFK